MKKFTFRLTDIDIIDIDIDINKYFFKRILKY